jgi:hypothetical protein
MLSLVLLCHGLFERSVCPSEETDMTTDLDDLSALIVVPRELEES